MRMYFVPLSISLMLVLKLILMLLMLMLMIAMTVWLSCASLRVYVHEQAARGGQTGQPDGAGRCRPECHRRQCRQYRRRVRGGGGVEEQTGVQRTTREAYRQPMAEATLEGAVEAVPRTQRTHGVGPFDRGRSAQ